MSAAPSSRSGTGTDLISSGWPKAVTTAARKPPALAVRLSHSTRTDQHSVLSVEHLEMRMSIAHLVVHTHVGVALCSTEEPAPGAGLLRVRVVVLFLFLFLFVESRVQGPGVGGVDLPFEHLDPVALRHT